MDLQSEYPVPLIWMLLHLQTFLSCFEGSQYWKESPLPLTQDKLCTFESDKTSITIWSNILRTGWHWFYLPTFILTVNNLITIHFKSKWVNLFTCWTFKLILKNLELVKVQQTQIVLLWKFYERECFILYYVRLLQFLQTNLFGIQTSSLLSNAIT